MSAWIRLIERGAITRATLENYLQAALEAMAANLPRVEITGANFEGAFMRGEIVQVDPSKLVATLECVLAALDLKEDGKKPANRSTSFADFSRREAGW